MPWPQPKKHAMAQGLFPSKKHAVQLADECQSMFFVAPEFQHVLIFRAEPEALSPALR